MADGVGIHSKVTNFIPFTYLTSIAYTSMWKRQYVFYEQRRRRR